MKPPNKTPKSQSVLSQRTKWIRNASIPPTSHLLSSIPAHLFPSSNFIYFNKLASDLPKKKKKSSVTLLQALPNKHTSHAWARQASKSSATAAGWRYTTACAPFQESDTTTEERDRVFTWYFLVCSIPDCGCYKAPPQLCRGPVSLQSCIAPSGLSCHFPSVLPRVSNQLLKVSI